MARSRRQTNHDKASATALPTPTKSTTIQQQYYLKRRPPRVIVIGAGMSGLTCARELKQRRYDVLVVEARDRCGGRVKGDDFRNVDLGGALIHGIQHNPIYKLVDQMGYPMKSKSSCLLLDENGTVVDSTLDQRVSRIFNDILEQTFHQTRRITKPGGGGGQGEKNGEASTTRKTSGNTTTTTTTTTATTTANTPTEAPSTLSATTDTTASKADAVISNSNPSIDSSSPTTTSSRPSTSTVTQPTEIATKQQSQPPSNANSNSSFGDVFDSIALPHLSKMTIQEQKLFDWHKANLEVSCGASFPNLGWRWNDDEPYGFDGEHMALQETSWKPIISQLKDGLDIWYKAPVKSIRIIVPEKKTETKTQTKQNEDKNQMKQQQWRMQSQRQPSRQRETERQPKVMKTPTRTPKSDSKPRSHTKRKHPSMASSESIVNKSSLSTTTTTTKAKSLGRSTRTAARAAAAAAATATAAVMNSTKTENEESQSSVRRSSRSTKGKPPQEKLSISFTRSRSYDESTIDDNAKPTNTATTTIPKATTKKTSLSSKRRIKTEQQQQQLEGGGEGHMLVELEEKPPAIQVQVTLEDGTVLQADTVICTLPLGILKLPSSHPNSVQFYPPLPQEKQTAIQRLGCGLFNKCCLVFSYVFWQQHIQDDYDFWGVVGKSECNTTRTVGDDGNNGAKDHNHHQQEQRNYLIVVNPGTVDPVTGETSLPMLTFWFGGDFAKHVEEWTDESIMKDCMATLETICGSGEVPPPLDYVVTRWGKETYSRGAFVYIPPGVDSDRELQTMSEPIFGEPIPKVPVRKTRSAVKLEDRPPPKPSILFAGEHTTPYHPSTIHGAYMSGLREAYRLDLANYPSENQDLTFSKEAIYQRTFTVKRIIPRAKTLLSSTSMSTTTRVSSPSPKRKSNDAMQLRKRPKTTTNISMTKSSSSTKALNGTMKGTTSSSTVRQSHHRRRNGVVVVQKRQSLAMPSRRSNRLTVRKEWEEHFRKINGSNNTSNKHGEGGGNKSQQDVSLLRAVQSYGCTTQEGLKVIQEKTLPAFASTLTGISMQQEHGLHGKNNGHKAPTPEMTTSEVQTQCAELLKSAAISNAAATATANSNGNKEVPGDDSNINGNSNGDNSGTMKPNSWVKWVAPEKDIVRDILATQVKSENIKKSCASAKTTTNDNHRHARSGRRIIPKKIIDL